MVAGHLVHGAGIAVVGVGGPDHQGLFCTQGPGNQVDEFGGAVARHHLSRIDAVKPGEGVNDAAGVHFRQGRDGRDIFR
jgi:hypothetical protein